MLRYLIFAGIFLFPVVINSFIIHVSVKHYKSSSYIQPSSNLSCNCDGKETTLKLPMIVLDRVFESVQRQDFCSENTAPKACSILLKCMNCTAVAVTCDRNPMKTTATMQTNENHDCYTKQLEKREKYMINKYDKNHAPKIFLAAQDEINALKQAAG